MTNLTIDWLLEESNPAIQYRTRTEILGQPADVNRAKEWIFSNLPEKWYDTKGLWYTYYITALAECGLTKIDIPKEYLIQAIFNIENSFEYGCADFMLLRAMVKLGFSEHIAVKSIIDNF